MRGYGVEEEVIMHAERNHVNGPNFKEENDDHESRNLIVFSS